MSKYQIQYGPNASLDGYDVDLASAGTLIESLRQQLAAAHENIRIANAQSEEFERKWYLTKDALEDSQKREVVLRNEVTRCRDWFETQVKVTSKGGPSSWELMLLRDERDAADQALATTADLKDVILCHAEPVGWCGTSGVGELIVSKSKVWNFLTTPLYRAWEPK